MTGLQAPNLDDRDFAALFAQARALIPRYMPEWTDHNLSDPGITLIQLFAAQAEQTLYRMNRVPELAYLKFLELLGIQLGTATPAGVELTFTTSGPTVDALVPTGTQVATSGGDNGPIVFEVLEGFTAIGARLAAVQTYDGTGFRDHSALLAAPPDGGLASLVSTGTASDVDVFGAHAPVEAALMLGYDTPGAFTANPISLYATLPPLPGGDVVRAGDAGPGAPAARMQAEFHDGTRWQPIAILTDQTQAFTGSGRLTVAGPGLRAARVKLGSVAESLYWLRFVLTASDYQNAPRLRVLAPNTVSALQGVTVRDEVLGGSDGMPGQGPFTLSTVPVIRGEEREVLRGDGRSSGSPTSSYVSTRAAEPSRGNRFRTSWPPGRTTSTTCLDRSSGEVRFGDGRNGRIPVANPAHPGDNIVAAWYRAGGSAAGNVGAGTVTSLQTAAFGVASVTNLAAASGGADPESVDQAKIRAPAVLKAGGRAVTAEDFETIALADPGRCRAGARAGVDRSGVSRCPGSGRGHRHRGADLARPGAGPDLHTLRAVCAELEQYRLITTQVFATGPTYRQVRVIGDLIVAPGSDLTVVQNAVSDRLTTWLHPLTGGDDRTGWPFGGTIYASSLLGLILTTPGVARIRDNQVLVELDGERQMFCRDVEIGVGELIEPLAAPTRGRVPVTARSPSFLLDQRAGWRLDPSVSTGVQTVHGPLTLSPQPAAAQVITNPSGSFGGLTAPTGVATGPHGEILVLDRSGHRVLRYDPGTHVFLPLGCLTSDPSLLGGATGIAVTGPGDVVLADPVQRRVLLVSGDGRGVRAVLGPFHAVPGVRPVPSCPDWVIPDGGIEPEPRWPAGDLAPWSPVAVAAAGTRIVVLDAARALVVLFDQFGRWCATTDGSGAGLPPLAQPIAVAIDQHGRIYVLESGRSVVRRLDPDGVAIADIASPEPYRDDFRPVLVAVDASGRLCISDQAGCLVLGAPMRCEPCDSGLDGAVSGLAFDRSGNPVLVDRDQQCVVRLSDGGGYPRRGEARTEPLDSGWTGAGLAPHRADRVHPGRAPPCRIDTLTAEAAVRPRHRRGAPADRWATGPEFHSGTGDAGPETWTS